MDKNKIIIIAVVVIVIAGGAYWWFKMRKPATKSAFDGLENDGYEGEDSDEFLRRKKKTIVKTSDGGIGEGIKRKLEEAKDTYEDGEDNFGDDDSQINKSFGGNLNL